MSDGICGLMVMVNSLPKKEPGYMNSANLKVKWKDQPRWEDMAVNLDSLKSLEIFWKFDRVN